ncbi:hypothetical protein SAMN04488047_14411 [Tranquillimonas alkanivorans]|uniref:Uncharacterized protein n=1 Tax=Tranquillimonas alkanivorans TaxID=441119 RepID=A0A1I5WDN4_9RHOB|nr:hypothetical protein SAMN04488047_14411 [Tranquillimonas alkanivorans]
MTYPTATLQGLERCQYLVRDHIPPWSSWVIDYRLIVAMLLLWTALVAGLLLG